LIDEVLKALERQFYLESPSEDVTKTKKEA
jgi:hypothetical protein